MSVHAWAELDRETLKRLLPESTVALPIGAIEQHGAHLPTGTDSAIAAALVVAAAERASARGATTIIAPTLSIGASEHHVPLGGTLSLRTETLLVVLIDVLSSMAAAGATSVLVVNGHGGNSGVCHAAASAASSRAGIDIAHVDYWRLIEPAEEGVPGHAGWFETSMILALQPSLVREVAPRTAPAHVPATTTGSVRHSPALWKAIDGYTDNPSLGSARRGADYVERLVEQLALALVEARA